MKMPKTTPEKPVPKTETKAEQPAVDETTQATAKKPNPVQKGPKKAHAKESKAKAEAAPKKPGPAQKTQAAAPKPVAAAPAMTIPERVGLTAGNIWHYLAENGATPVSKLVKELAEEEKIIQRSIGWLAQEGKITLDTSGRVETIALKD